MPYNEDQLRDAVSRSVSLRGVLKLMGIRSGHSYTYVRAACHRFGISIDHLSGRGWRRGTFGPEKPIEYYLSGKVQISSCRLKRRLLKNGMLANECTKCGQGPIWQGEELILHLDHVDGNTTNNNLVNLRILCPNCHTQTPTYGRTKSFLNKEKKEKRIGNRKVTWPSKEELACLVWRKPTTDIAKDFGVSDKAVTKWCKEYEISKPPIGYWTKMRSRRSTDGQQVATLLSAGSTPVSTSNY